MALQDLVEAVTGQNSFLKSTMDAIGVQTQSSNAAANSLENDTAAGTDANGNTALGTQVAGLGKLQSQEATQKDAVALGRDPEQTQDLLRTLGKNYIDAAQEAIKAKQDYQDKQSVGILDDPIAYILNKITEPDDRQYVEATQSTADTIKQTASNINQLIQQDAITNDAIKTQVTAASVDSQTKAVQANIDANVQRQKIANAQTNISALQTQAQISQNQLANGFSLQSQENEDKKLGLSQQELALHARGVAVQEGQLAVSEAYRDAQMKQLDIVMRKENEDLALRADMVSTVGKAYIAKGLEPPTANEIKLKMQTPKTKDEIENALMVGLAIGKIGGKAPIIGVTPADAAKSIMQTGANLNPVQDPIKALLTNSIQTTSKPGTTVLGANGKSILVDPKDINSILSATNADIGNKVKDMLGNVDSTDKSNIYAFPPVTAILTATPQLQTDPFVLKVFGPRAGIAGADIPQQPSDLIAMGASAIKNGDLTLAQVQQGISKLVTAGIMTNNNTKNYMTFGLPNQASFNTSIRIPTNTTAPLQSVLPFSMTSDSIKANLAVPSEVNRVLVQYMAQLNKSSLF